MFEKHAKKGRLVYVAGKLQTRRWKKDEEDSDRFSTEILIAPGGRVQFLDKVNGNGNGNGAHPETADVAVHRGRSRAKKFRSDHSGAGATRVGPFFFAPDPEEVRPPAPFPPCLSLSSTGNTR